MKINDPRCTFPSIHKAAYFYKSLKITIFNLIIKNMHSFYTYGHSNDFKFYQILPVEESLYKYMYYILLNN